MIVDHDVVSMIPANVASVTSVAMLKKRSLTPPPKGRRKRSKADQAKYGLQQQSALDPSRQRRISKEQAKLIPSTEDINRKYLKVVCDKEKS